MGPKIAKLQSAREFLTPERCYIVETWRSKDDGLLTVARARVEPGMTTEWHALEGVTERYLISEGKGRMEVGDLPSTEVAPGDTVFIPAGLRQRITNDGAQDLVFYCICTPPFHPDCYRSLETEK